MAREPGVSTPTLIHWVKQDAIDRGGAEGLSATEREELARLRREVNVLRQERAILERAAAFFAARGRPPVRFAFIRSLADLHPVSILCRLLGVSRSGFCAFRDRRPSARRRRDGRCKDLICAIREGSGRICGSRRVRAELRPGHGMACGKKRVGRLMRELSIPGRGRSLPAAGPGPG